ncbi:4'-phosphopantetheinyl transferase family protein [Streptomyces californicus]|uniref:4'-phosphopantetheinyl transferase family protein n=1 Tax=Streptomyces californicus TaxID=67351 RepID=UPI0037B09BB8
MNDAPDGAGRPAGPVTEVWTLAERDVPELAARIGGTGVLTPDERARHLRRRTPGARRRFLGGRLLRRFALSARTGLPPDSWRYVEGPYGRPEIAADHRGLRFNVAHTDGLIACVVSEGCASGVDVERTPFDDRKVRLLTPRFGPEQRAELAAAPDPAAALARTWVLSEAYLKGLGVGLADGLGALRFRRRPGSAELTVADARRPDACRRWRFHLTGHGTGHLLAVAVDDGGAGRLLRRDLTSSGSLARSEALAAGPRSSAFS